MDIYSSKNKNIYPSWIFSCNFRRLKKLTSHFILTKKTWKNSSLIGRYFVAKEKESSLSRLQVTNGTGGYYNEI